MNYEPQWLSQQSHSLHAGKQCRGRGREAVYNLIITPSTEYIQIKGLCVGLTVYHCKNKCC
jgi:hypothetical protein